MRKVMNPKKPSKKRAGDETFKAQQEKTSISTVESGPASAERQPKPKRKMGDATYKPRPESPSTSTLETEKRRSPGRPRRNAKPATYLQPRATSEATELRLEQHGTPNLQNAPAPDQSSSSSSSDGASLSTTDRLKNMRDFLTVEDALTHPHFSAECDAMETFLSDLAGAKEMFDVSVYHDVKAMLRMHRERMMEMERERNEVVTYKVPSYSTTEYTTESCGSRAAGVTYRMPSFSTAESELRARVFSPAQGARGAETDATSVGGMEGWDDYGDGDTADVFHGGWSPVRTSERDYGSAVARGKRPAARAAAQRPGHAPTKRLRRTEQEEEPTWLKEKTPETTDLPTSSRSHGYNQNDDLQDLVARSDSTPKSGSLIPPEIADFDTLDEGEAPLPTTRTTTTTRKTKKAKTTTWKNDIAIDSNDDENDPLQKFYPGDPVFMFGETKYLQALQSRRMEKDLAGDDEETQAAIDARPLMGMFARFRLPDAGTAAVVGEGREMGRVGVVGGRREGRGGSNGFCTMS